MLLLTRRGFLDTSAFGILLASTSARLDAQPALASTPFTLGVASGDPLADSVVIWTRLAPAPLERLGGMPPVQVRVAWEVARDDQFRDVIRRGTAAATPATAHAVHVEVPGLAPATPYWYRFRVATWESPAGRTRTAPAPGAPVDALRFAFVSCQRWEQGHFTALRHLAEEDLSVIFHLGDYIYEYATPETYVRRIEGTETIDLDQYRQRYAQYRTDPHLQAAHASAPFVVTWDDHEVDNDYADAHAEDKAPRDAFLRRRAAAYQAYYEHMPLRRHRRPTGPDMPLYRSLGYGTLADFQVLDTRQYRTPQPCGAPRAALCDGARDPRATILGPRQRQWLFSRLDRSTARWNVLAQQVMMTPVDVAAGPPAEFSMDKWNGYEADRRAVLAFLRTRQVTNPIVLTGDIHSNWVCDLKERGDPDAPILGTEFIGTSISSGGDGQELPPRVAEFLPDNPHVRFFNGQRGYVRCVVTPDRWQSDYRIVPFVTRPGAPIDTTASFVVEHGRPGAQRA